jgi:hypothetical protein
MHCHCTAAADFSINELMIVESFAVACSWTTPLGLPVVQHYSELDEDAVSAGSHTLKDPEATGALAPFHSSTLCDYIVCGASLLSELPD